MRTPPTELRRGPARVTLLGGVFDYSRQGLTTLTGMVDVPGDRDERVHARPPDLVPNRTGTMLAAWLKSRP